MVSDPFLVGLFFGFVPAMGFLYILLNRYEGFFVDKRVFRAFFLGFGVGLVATIGFLVLGPRSGDSIGLVTLFCVLFGLIEALLFAMVLNSKSYRRQRETPYYGLAFGLGFGALNVLFMVGNAVQLLARAGETGLVEALSVTLLGTYFIGSILVHAGVGAWLGRGSARARILPDLARGTVAEALYLGIFFVLLRLESSTLLAPAALGASIVFIAFVLRTVIDPIVPPEIRREMEIHNRRVARRVMSEATSPSGTDPGAARTGDAPAGEPGPRAPPSP